MVDDVSNDNDAAHLRPSGAAEASGRAAIWLVESLIHTLVTRKIITIEDAVDIVEVAEDVAKENMAEIALPQSRPGDPLAILQSINASLRIDIGR